MSNSILREHITQPRAKLLPVFNPDYEMTITRTEYETLLRRIEFLEMQLGIAHSTFNSFSNTPAKNISSSSSHLSQDLQSESTSNDAISFGENGIKDSMEGKDASDNCLFVGNLDNTKTGKQLHDAIYRHFGQLGEVTHVKVSKDSCNRPFALVYFSRPGLADAILSKGKNTILDGRHLRVEKSRSNKTIYLSHIPAELPMQEVRRRIEFYGPVKEFQMLQQYQSASHQGLAFVTYTTRTSAMAALAGLRKDTAWMVEPKVETKTVVGDQFDHRSIFIGKLDYNLITPTLLRMKFGRFGHIELIHLMIHPFQKIATAYLKYLSPASCYRAVEFENNALWLGQQIRVEIKRTDL